MTPALVGTECYFADTQNRVHAFSRDFATGKRGLDV
jgi:hypothetical protein